jgi:serine-type D-Ala-D-Ala carboxypeptidase/endopeptidase (penicillin-binding protein 4)
MFNFQERHKPGYYLLPIVYGLLLASCSVQKQISGSATQLVIKDSSLTTAHVGISIYEPAANKYWYNYQGDKYFVPASNTKLPTCYAAMKYLGDSLVGLRYGIPEEPGLKKSVFAIKSTGDPSFLHSFFSNQPIFDFLKNQIIQAKLKCAVYYDTLESTEGLGSGWAWNDYEETYMAEHNRFPVFGNLVNISLRDMKNRRTQLDSTFHFLEVYSLFNTGNHFFDSIVNRNQEYSQTYIKIKNPSITIRRDFSVNDFYVQPSDVPFREKTVPFVTHGMQTTINFLKDTLKGTFEVLLPTDQQNIYQYDCEGCDVAFLKIKNWTPIHSQPTDSLLKPMMHRSDNFFAEQTLLMISNERLGYMNDEKIIDTLLKTDFKDLPQKPRWVDGSGLSRYNLFTPQDFVAILNKIKNEFGMERIKNILPTGGTGTQEK